MPHQYLTNQEFQDAPTGLNLTNLIPDGTTAQETQALTRLLQRASAVVDRWCRQPLFAQSRTDTFHVYPDNHGNITVLARQFPVQSVSNMQYQLSPQSGWLALPMSGAQVDPVSYPSYPQIVTAFGYYGYLKAYGPILVQMSYVAGFVSTTLGAATLANATTFTVADPTGITVGLTIPIEDGVNSEDVTVQSISGNVITPTSPLVNPHAIGAGVSLIPQEVKQAVIMIATFLLNERSTGEVDMGFGSSAPTMGKVKNVNEYQLGIDLLQPLKVVAF